MLCILNIVYGYLFALRFKRYDLARLNVVRGQGSGLNVNRAAFRCKNKRRCDSKSDPRPGTSQSTFQRFLRGSFSKFSHVFESKIKISHRTAFASRHVRCFPIRDDLRNTDKRNMRTIRTVMNRTNASFNLVLSPYNTVHDKEEFLQYSTFKCSKSGV